MFVLAFGTPNGQKYIAFLFGQFWFIRKNYRRRIVASHKNEEFHVNMRTCRLFSYYVSTSRRSYFEVCRHRCILSSTTNSYLLNISMLPAAIQAFNLLILSLIFLGPQHYPALSFFASYCYWCNKSGCWTRLIHQFL